MWSFWSFCQPGMRFIQVAKMRGGWFGGGSDGFTKVENAPKSWRPPKDKPNEGGGDGKRVLGTIKRTGFVVLV